MRIKKLPGFDPEELCISCGRPEPSPLLAIWSLHLWGVGFGLLDDLEPVVLKKLAERPPNSEVLSKCISAELRPQEWALRWAIPREDAITLDKMGSPLALVDYEAFLRRIMHELGLHMLEYASDLESGRVLVDKFDGLSGIVCRNCRSRVLSTSAEPRRVTENSPQFRRMFGSLSLHEWARLYS